MARLTSRDRRLGIQASAAIWHGADLSLEERHQRYGTVGIEGPRQIVAADHATIAFSMRIGESPLRPSAVIALTYSRPYDFGPLQSDDPKAENFVRVSARAAGGRAAFDVRYDDRAGVAPYRYRLAATLTDGILAEGDEVRIVCGDREAGGMGWRAPSFSVPELQCLLLIDYEATGQWIRLPDPPTLKIVAGPPAALIVNADSQGTLNEPISVSVRAVDAWGNPTTALRARGVAPPTLAGAMGFNAVLAEEPGEEFDVYRFRVRFSTPGVHRLTASLQNLCQAESNPIVVNEASPPLQIYWGDLHSGQCEIGCGAGTLDGYYRYGRDIAGLHFITHQANDYYVTSDEWKQTRALSEAFNEPGKYVVFLGCEWTSSTAMGGDRCVFYRCDEPHLWRSDRWFTESEPDDEPTFPTVREFHDAFKDRDVLVNLHVGGNRSNLDYYLPGIERLAEVHSTHATSEWFIEDCLRRGHTIGITGGSDGVMCRPGADSAGPRMVRSCRNGLTAVYATELTRPGLWRALLARRCYATTGERIILSFDVDGHPMGDEFETIESPKMNVSAVGTAPIEYVELLCGTSLLRRWSLAPARPSPQAGEHYLRLLWSGAEQRAGEEDAVRGSSNRRHGSTTVSRQQPWQVDWTGSLHVEEGAVLEARGINFQSPLDDVEVTGFQDVRWHSMTAGGEAAVTVLVRGEDTTQLTVKLGSRTLSYSLVDVLREPATTDLDGLGKRFAIGPAPDTAASRSCNLSMTDETPRTGRFPYWVRVVQADSQRAWSSPVYVRRLAR